MSDLREINKYGFATRITVGRRNRKLKISEAADLVGVDRNTYAKWENPERKELPRDLKVAYRLSQTIGLGMHFMVSGSLEHEQDSRFTKRIDALHYRQSTEPEFNALIRLIQDMQTEEIKALTTLIEYSAHSKGKHRKVSRIRRRRGSLR